MRPTISWFGCRQRISFLADVCLKTTRRQASATSPDADVTAWPKTLDKVKAKFPPARYVVPDMATMAETELIEHTKQIVNQYIESTSKP